MLDALRSIANHVTPIALDVYDKEDTASLLSLLAQIVPNPGKRKKFSLEWVTAFPELRQWIGERTIQRAFKENFEIEGQKYEITMEYDANDAEREDGLVKAEGMAVKIATQFAAGKTMLAYAVLKRNDLTYDGQNLFDTDHVHPNGTSFSNLITVVRADAANPTVVEARAEFKKARVRLMQNRLVRNLLVKTAEVKDSLIVIARSDGVWNAYNDLNTEEKIGDDTNRFRGTFQLLRDFDPPAGESTSLDVIEALPSGPRPVVFCPTREPNGVRFDTSKEFSHALIPFGMDAEYAARAAFPQPVVRMKP